MASIANSQDSELLTLPRLRDVSQVPWKNEIYRLPGFQTGSITLATGFKLDHTLRLNYNIYYERMDFLKETGDTLSIGNPREIKLIEIGDHVFYHDYKSGYYEILVASTVSLAAKPRLILVRINGVCGGIASFETRGDLMDCDRMYQKTLVLVFIDLNSKIWNASRASILKLFPRQKAAIQEYLATHKIDFNSAEDMTKLLEFCHQLGT